MIHPDLLSNESSLPYLQRALKGKYYDTGKLGVYEVDQYLRLKDGEFVVVVGHANVGKTHTLLYLMLLQSYNFGKKWLIYSAENEVPSLKRKLIEFITSRSSNAVNSLLLSMNWKYSLMKSNLRNIIPSSIPCMGLHTKNSMSLRFRLGTSFSAE